MYQLTRLDHVVIRLADRAFLQAPGPDEECRHWRAYQDWLAEGNRPMPAEPVPDNTLSATRLTPKEKLQRAGLTVEELKALIAEPVRELLAEQHPEPPTS